MLTCPIRDVMFGGARGGGKSQALLGDAAYHCFLHRERANVYIFRRSYVDLEELMDDARLIYEPLGAKWNITAKRFIFPHWGNASIRFRYLDRDADAGHYQGRNINYIGIDEAGQFPTPTAIDMLWGALRSGHGVTSLLRLTCNPGGPGHEWLAERYVNPCEPMKINRIELPDGSIHKRVFIPSKVEDNQILMENDPEYKSRLYLVGAPWLVEAWLKGDWNARPEGHFFDTTRLRYGIPPPITKFYLGCDIATRDSDAPDRSWRERDYTALVTVGVDHYKRPWILDIVRKRMNTEQWVAEIIRLHLKYKYQRIWIEGGPIFRAVEPWLNRIQQMSGTYLPIKDVQPAGAGDKAVRATPLQTVMNSGALWVPKDKTPWLHDFLTECSIFDPAKARKNEIHDDQVDAAAWVFLKLLELSASRDPTSLAVTGSGPVGKHLVSKGQLDGKTAEDVLKRMEAMKRERSLQYDPSAW